MTTTMTMMGGHDRLSVHEDGKDEGVGDVGVGCEG